MRKEDMKNMNDLLDFCYENYSDKNVFAYGEPSNRQNITYSSFVENIRKGASLYKKKGFSGNKHIAILGENSYEWILNFFAIACSGNVAVLFDKAQNVDLLTSLVKRMDVSCIVYSDDYKDEAEEIANNVEVKLLSMKAMSNLEDVEDKFKRIDFAPDKELLIAFTSGTTGEPKGVVLSHYNVLSSVLRGLEIFTCSGNTVLLLPLHHMFGIGSCLIGSLLVGANIYINSSLRYVPQDLMESRASFLLAVPMVLENALKVFQGMKSAGLPVPEKIMSGGAPVNEELSMKYAELGMGVYNAYGITECSPGIAVSPSPIGIGKTSMKTLDEIQINNPDKDGKGEILVKGSNVMLGYYGQEDETKKVIVDGWFHTGDAGYLSEGNMITITGRIKNLIVLPNGENIAPEELEAGLSNLPLVEDVIVKQVDSDLVAEIYPQSVDTFTEEQENELKKTVGEWTRTYPVFKRITKVEIRRIPFEKTTTLKIKRF